MADRIQRKSDKKKNVENKCTWCESGKLRLCSCVDFWKNLIKNDRQKISISGRKAEESVEMGLADEIYKKKEKK